MKNAFLLIFLYEVTYFVKLGSNIKGLKIDPIESLDLFGKIRWQLKWTIGAVGNIFIVRFFSTVVGHAPHNQSVVDSIPTSFGAFILVHPFPTFLTKEELSVLNPLKRCIFTTLIP